MNCTQCQNEMKLIPAGYSQKKQRSYNAFFKCEACGTSQNAPIQGNGQQRPPQQPQQATQQAPRSQPNGYNKDRSIQVQCAIKCACMARPGGTLEEILLLASNLDMAMTRGARVAALPGLTPAPPLGAPPDPPEWTASHPDEPPPDDNDPWAQDWQNRGRA